ncbi:receptor-like protein kinase 2 [Selaginella moellendorffii]|nr:receptor-like protein kinase 2 [Selaginella moellendorffii]XP_024524009.1 receptor-like protein kinase 2 [Selaginella moellendorffii]XP_024524015.1 receptor-like protein kinase 2 [Selaginella moellendorffii]XP_024524021.1 receptor-like protein kinase 2 [Selaginella moellendorffii]XP_024524029.1 receptor-like protein kinase 2 [Selaginella moellendorffii]|eukprot:XP_024524005.1 receptor-like protein kinase 2 [Selaginella moellendorffii]
MSLSNLLLGLFLLVFLATSRSQCPTNPSGIANDTQTLLSLGDRLGIKAWNETANPRAWRGVEWSSDNRVEGLNMSRLNLSGVLPSIWAELPSLARLDLSQNNIFSLEVAGCKNTQLKLLNLSSNSLQEVPANLSSLESLESLDLSGNFLGVAGVPKFSSTLRSLNLSINNLTGSVSIGGNLGLEALELSHNGFSGSIPETFGEMTNLTRLDISYNRFTGDLPDIWSKNLELRYLDISNNSLQGGLPPSLRRLRKLSVLSARSNFLSGPLELEDGDFASIETLHLFQNLFNGTVPARVGSLTNLRMLVLTQNRFSGAIPPELGNCSNIREIWLNGNDLTGTIPGELSKLSHLQQLVLNGNDIGGELPSGLSNCTELVVLWLEQNKFSGNLPDSFANLSRLLILSLSGNDLVGSIPASYGKMSSLIGLDVGSNSLSGEVPAMLQNVSTLQFLFLSNNSFSGSIPDWLPRLRNLRAMDFSLNRFSGEIPASIGRLFANVQLYNMTNTTPLVHAQSLVYSGFAFPTTIDFSSNQLSGSIPATIGDLHNLQVLDLSHNQLTGPIPDSLGNAKNLSRVTLASNRLNGSIPSSVADLSFLTVFDVSNNSLVGRIPYSPQLSSMDVALFAGNHLCGAPVANCSSSAAPPGGIQSRGGELESQEATRRKTLIPIVIAIFAAAFFCVFLAMYFALARRRHKLYSNTDRDNASFSLAFCEKLPEQISARKLAAATDNFSGDNVVGDGGFGVVYRAVLENGQVVAVKKLSSCGLQGDREFRAELQTLGELKHKNLVPLLGYCSDNNDRLLIYKYLKNGSVDTWLYCREPGMKPLDWPTRLRIARGAAQGIAYLHQGCEQRHAIIHRDIKVSNILLDEEFEAHVADFGLARLVNAGETHVSTDVAGTIGYIPPEYSHKCFATPKGDVYSFGVVCLEMLTAKRPTDQFFRKNTGLVAWVLGLRSGEEKRMALDECLRERCEHGAEFDQMVEMMRIACWCCRDAPSKRPSMQEVASLLERLEKRVVLGGGGGGGSPTPLLERDRDGRSSSTSSSSSAPVDDPCVVELTTTV